MIKTGWSGVLQPVFFEADSGTVAAVDSEILFY
jgi:hypothetical protein